MLVAPLLLAGCVESDGIRRLRPLEIATGPYSATITSAHAGSLMNEGGCILFREAAGGGNLFPVWPIGSVFNGAAVTFHQPGKADQPVVIAQQFVMSGREVGWSDLPAGYAPFQHQCGTTPFLVSKVRPAD